MCFQTIAEAVSVDTLMAFDQFSHNVIHITRCPNQQRSQNHRDQTALFLLWDVIVSDREVGRAVRKFGSVTALCSAVLFD